MIRDQYGLTIEWEKGEVRERKVFTGKLTSVKIDGLEWADQFTDHLSETMNLPRDVLLAPMDGTYKRQRMRDLEMAKMVEEQASKFEVTLTGGDSSLTMKYEASVDGENWFDWKGGGETHYPVLHLRPKVPSVEESFGPVKTANGGTSVKVGEDGVAHISMPITVYDEVSELALARQAEEVRNVISTWPEWKKAYIGPKSVNDVPPVEESFGPVKTANGGTSYDFASVAPAAEDLVDADMSSPGTEWKAAKNAILTKKKSYSDTPTGTVEWDEKKGEALRKNVERLEKKRCFGLRKPFCDALHLVPYEDEDFTGTDIACPVCGREDVSTTTLLVTNHVSGLFENISDEDQEVIDELKDGVTCESCDHHLTYDFDNETVTIRTTSSHCVEREE
jgi:hypothetical protein